MGLSFRVGTLVERLFATSFNTLHPILALMGHDPPYRAYIAPASFPLCWRFLLARANKPFTASTKACAPPGSKYTASHFVQTSARIPETETRSPSRSNS